MNLRAERWLAPVVGLVGLVAGWELVVRVFDVPSYELPPPTQVVRALVETRAVLPRHLWATTSVAVGGLVVGALAGVVIAALLTAVDPLRRALQPLLVASQSVPIVVLAPLLYYWFDFGARPRILVVALVVFFPIAVATLDGLREADPELVEMVRAMGASPLQVLARVRVPNALGSFFSGLRISAAYAMFGAVVAEWVGTDRGLGLYLERSADSYLIDQVFVAVVLIAAVSVALFTAVALLARLATPWQVAGRRLVGPDPREPSP